VKLAIYRHVGFKMSLSISVHLIDEVSRGIGTEIPLPPGGDLAGFEVWRKALYGSDDAVGLGLTLLPTLRHADILATGEDINKLKKEAKCVMDHAALFASRIGVEERVIRVRAENIRRACVLALSQDGMVWIS
jgi:hypothetical protein